MDTGQDPASVARAIAAEFVEGFNARDDQRHREVMNFPSVIFVDGRFKLWERPEDYALPWDRFVESEGWHRSTLDSVEVVQVGLDKVHLSVSFSRYDAHGVRYSTRQGLWVVTHVDGHWGIQCRSNFIPDE